MQSPCCMLCSCTDFLFAWITTTNKMSAYKNKFYIVCIDAGFPVEES